MGGTRTHRQAAGRAIRKAADQALQDVVVKSPLHLVIGAAKAPADDTNPKDRLGSLKVPLRLVPGVAEILVAQVFELGAYKYGEFNWRNKAVRITVYIEAIKRHNLALNAGEDIDPESGLPHAAHIMACSMLIEDARAAGALIDDRFEKDMAAVLLNAFTSQQYDAAAKATTRTPAHSLTEVRGPLIPYHEFMKQVVDGVRERQAKRSLPAA